MSLASFSLRPGSARSGALCFLGLILTGCAGSRPASVEPQVPAGGRVITTEQIAASGASPAWEALRRAAPHLELLETDEEPARIRRRGSASVLGDDQVWVYLDGVRLADIRMLTAIPAADIVTIQSYSGAEAPVSYGRSASGETGRSVILIRTRTGVP